MRVVKDSEPGATAGALTAICRNGYRISFLPWYPHANGPMFMNSLYRWNATPAGKRWSRLRARVIGPRRHLRALPSRTRPSLYSGD